MITGHDRRGAISDSIVSPFMSTIGMSFQVKQPVPFVITKTGFLWKYIHPYKFHKTRSKKIIFLVRLNKLHEKGLGNNIFFFRLTIRRLGPRKNPMMFDSVNGGDDF
jgi:hypothetical protein